MVSVQRSIEIRVPVHTLYQQLTQFEDYPQFMQDIESVEQRDATHLHWKARMMNAPVEWDAVITECIPDQHIAWQSENGPGNAGKLELQAVGTAASRLTITLVSEIDFEPVSPAGDVKAEFSERIWEDLARLRSMVEAKRQQGTPAQTGSGVEAGTSAGRKGIDEVVSLGGVERLAQQNSTAAMRNEKLQQAVETVQRDRGSPGNPVPATGFAAGSEGFSGDEDPSAPVTSASHMQVSEASRTEKSKSFQSDYSVSKSAEGGMQDERDSIAEEVSFDQQSDAARHIGNLPVDDANGTNEGFPNAEVIAKATQRKRPEPEF
jgi:hypothetical protein